MRKRSVAAALAVLTAAWSMPQTSIAQDQSNPSPGVSCPVDHDHLTDILKKSVKPGGTPHRWYSPPDVHQVIDRVTADFKRIDPADAAYFDGRRNTFTAVTLGRYTSLITEIKAKYAGTPVGASESIFAPLADALGLDLRTPASFLTAISEGTEPTAADKSTIDAQIKNARAKAEEMRARVQTAQAARDLAALDLAYTKILAPTDGVASKKTAVVGQMLQPGQPVVFRNATTAGPGPVTARVAARRCRSPHPPPTGRWSG